MFELTATAMWLMGGIAAVILGLSRFIFLKLESEINLNRHNLATKVDTDTMHAMEARFKEAIERVEEDNERVITRIEQKHERDIEQVTTRLSHQIHTTEVNILAQLKLVMTMMGKFSTN